ncbi:MAG: hypothetical protein IPN77_24810 [Sandaracinaceae bacterium]|nr:hypothetical protein [Sandaracinaceae bacterium]
MSQFLSPLTNRREDAWGGSLENRARFGRAVLSAIRAAVGPAFPVAIRLNSADFQRGGFTEDEASACSMLQADGGRPRGDLGRQLRVARDAGQR